MRHNIGLSGHNLHVVINNQIEWHLKDFTLETAHTVIHWCML